MNKSKRNVFIAVIVAAMLFVVGGRAVPVGANTAWVVSLAATSTPIAQLDSPGMTVSVTQQEEIKRVIQSYFEIRYRALNTLQLEGFGDLVSDSPEAKAFLDAELGKLAVEIKHAELNHLRYADYRYYLDFSNFTADNSSQIAMVSVVEEHDVIEEISMELDPEDPFVSHRYGLEHTIVLHKEQDQWKITSDYYNDYLWRMLRQTGRSTDEILRTLKASPRPALRSTSAETGSDCALPDDDSTHAYDRDNAVSYALEHVASENYNRDYPSYDGTTWGDCTNFISQAIYEGGNASMSIPEPLPSPTPGGQSGWYLLNGLQRATDWNLVGGFYNFITDPSAAITEGPEGCDTTINNLMKGDVIQYDWADDGAWDHSVIVVYGEGTGDPYVASHSPNDVRHYTNFELYVPNTSQIRFIRVERSDGNPPIKAQVKAVSDDAGIHPVSCAYSSPDNEVYLGNCADGRDITSGFRFNDIEVPRYAHIKYAYITFAVDGPYVDSISVKIYGEAAGNSDTFTASSPPDSRTTTSEESAVLWEITDRWDLTDNLAGIESRYSRTTPQLAPVIQEIVNHMDWAPGHSLSIIIKNAGSGTVHRRVIAWERADWDPNLSSARLIIAYEGGSPAPSSTPTATATPTATPTSTPTSTPTPTVTPSPTVTLSPEPTSPPLWRPAENVLMQDEPSQKREAFSELLSQIRDQVLVLSPKGDAYIETVYQHAPEIMTLLLQDENLRQQIKDLALEVQPLLESMVGNGLKSDEPRLEKTWVEKAVMTLSIVEEQASPALREEIKWWQAHLPDFSAKTGKEIWEMLPYR
jgi:hypothetical protein